MDERGNRGQISNIVTVYIHEVTTTTVTTTTGEASTLDPYLILKYLKNKNLSDTIDEESFLRNISENLEELERSNSEIYIAVGIVCGVVTMIVILLITVVLISRRKRGRRHDGVSGVSSAQASTTTSNTSQVTIRLNWTSHQSVSYSSSRSCLYGESSPHRELLTTSFGKHIQKQDGNNLIIQ